MESPSFDLNEMKANYPYFRTFVMSKMKEEFTKSLEPLAGDNLEEIARQEEALPLEAFIGEIEKGDDM